MMWHERQNCVCLERSMCSEVPIAAQRIGRMKSATKARILPPRVAVTDGRKTRMAISTMLRPIRMKRIVMGLIMLRLLRCRTASQGPRNSDSLWVAERSANSLLLAQLADVGNELFDLLCGQRFLEPWHFALALGSNLDKLGVGLLVNFRRTEVSRTELLARRCVPASVCGVAGSALGLVEVFDIVLRPCGQCQQSRDDQGLLPDHREISLHLLLLIAIRRPGAAPSSAAQARDTVLAETQNA